MGDGYLEFFKKLMICDICGKEGARLRRVSRSYGKGRSLLIVENVPVVCCARLRRRIPLGLALRARDPFAHWVRNPGCPSCSESYLTGETLHELERIKLHRRSMAKPRRVPVATFV